MKTENANARSNGPSNGSRSGRKSLRASRRDAVGAAGVEDPLRRIAAEEAPGRHVARKHPRQPAPAAAEVEHARGVERHGAVRAKRSHSRR